MFFFSFFYYSVFNNCVKSIAFYFPNYFIVVVSRSPLYERWFPTWGHFRHVTIIYGFVEVEPLAGYRVQITIR